ncbi:ABC transporter permease [Peristeroidobacter agariperforans]|uniref:ABC transporter permease n=1 Tax=Peristeroidobacter agariperforans TaxID=268404 RepID=UPI00101D0666|nr:ABC transporter permease [Peristeroidobacter agariperforans]
MLANYFAAAIRNLLRNRAYTLINLFGLSLGFAAATLIALYARDEFSYDRFIPNHDRIYLVGEVVEPPGRSAMRLSVTSTTDAEALKFAFPEIETATRLAPSGLRLSTKQDNEGAALDSFWADPNFFDVFPLRSIAGDLANALSQPDSLVLTSRAARQLFSREDAVGETVRVGPDAVMRVAAVVENLPSNSHLNCDVFLPGAASFSPLVTLTAEQRQPGALRSENAYTYVRLRGDASIDDVRSRLRAFTDSHVRGDVNGTPIAKSYTFTLTPLADVHLQPRSIGDLKPPVDVRVLHALIGVALLILVVACGNFISMMTARASRRAVEVGVRKAAGATQRQIMIQFMGECLFYGLLALIPAVVAVELVLPAFNGFLRREIAFDYLTEPSLGLGLIGLTVLTGLAAGAYPALYLSRFKPNAVLRGTTLTPQSSRARQSLVVAQFAILIALLVATFTVNRQIHFAIEDRLRLPTDQIYLASPALGCPTSFTDALPTLGRVKAVTCVSGSTLGFDHISVNFISPHGGGNVNGRAAQVDYSFFDVFGIQPIAGRLLSPQFGQDDLLRKDQSTADNPTIVINEAAARALGYSSPAEAVGTFARWQRLSVIDGRLQFRGQSSSKIAAVVPDFSIGSVRDVVGPTAYYIDPTVFSRMVFRFDGGSVQQSLESVRDLWEKHSSSPFQGMFLDQFVNALYEDVLTQSAIFTWFSAVAIVLAALGLLGLAIFTAERRTKEIGLRKVMGARRTDILLFLGWRFARPVLWANLIAWPCAYLVMQRWLQGFAYHTEIGVLTFVIAGALALAIALATVAGHAMLVARAKPMEALRYE